jgi:molybdate/tungstate transport system substrate-binding protein
LGVGWSSGSKFSVQLGAAAGGRQTLQSVLSTSGISIGRTDPQLDPKGAYTISAVRLWLGDEGERTLLGADENPAQIFPEEDLLARIETGQADVGFFYRTEALARHLHFIPLPGNASMSSKITYTLAVLAHSPHPQQARAFADFVLRGPGRAILERAGLTYFDPAIRVDIP